MRNPRVDFLALDPDSYFHDDGTGFFSRRFGIGIYSEVSEDDPQEPVEGVSVF